MKKAQPGRYLPEWAEFEAVADRETRKRGGPGIRAGTIVRAVLSAFLALTEQAQGKVLEKAFSAKLSHPKKVSKKA